MKNFCLCGHYLDDHVSGEECVREVADGFFCGYHGYEEEAPSDYLLQGYIDRLGDGIAQAFRAVRQ